jgi:hypothetical protein
MGWCLPCRTAQHNGRRGSSHGRVRGDRRRAGIGPAIAERLAAAGTVLAVELDPAGLDWVDGSRVRTILGREPQP